MENGGEGVVAILQSVNNGLVVTLLSRQTDQAYRKPSFKSDFATAKPYLSKSFSVETSTDIVPERGTGRDVRLTDDQYMSSYQVAHCQQNLSLPPVPLTEFPPQRSKPNNKQGNFQIGRSSTTKSCTRIHLLSEQRWRVLNYNGPTFCNDAFVESLRKYPRTPGRSISSELLEKLIRRTQIKYSQNVTRTKSLKSLDYDKLNNIDFNQNGCTDSKDQEMIEKKRKANTNRRASEDYRPGSNREKPKTIAQDDLFIEPNTKSVNKSFRSHKSGIDSLAIRSNDVPFDTTYNYLKASNAAYIHQSERQLRLAEFGKQVQKTLKLIRNQHPIVFQICPKLQKRYNQHKKSCIVKSPAASITNATRKKVCVPKLSPLLSVIDDACVEPSSSRLTSSKREIPNHCTCSKASQCCHDVDSCKNKNSIKDSVCQCCPKTHGKSTQAQRECICKTDGVKYVCPCTLRFNTEYYKSKLDEAVTEWLNNIPVPGNEKLKDKLLRETKINELTDRLKELVDYDQLQDGAQEVIEKALADIPMWHPGSNDDKARLKSQLVDDLLSTIMRIPKKPDKLSDTLKKFVDSLIFDGEDNVDKQDIFDKVLDRIKYFSNHMPDDDNELKSQLVVEIASILEGLSLQNSNFKVLDTVTNRLAHDLASILRDTPHRSSSGSTKYKSHSFYDDGEYNTNSLNSQDATIAHISANLDELQSQFTNTRNQMINEIKSVLYKLNIPEVAIDNLAETLIDNITDALSDINKKNVEITLQQNILKELDLWLKKIPGVDELNQQEQQTIIKALSENLKNARADGNENYENVIFKTLASSGADIKPKLITSKVEELANYLKSLPKPILAKDLKVNMRTDFGSALDKLQVSKSETDLLLNDTFQKIVTDSPKLSSTNGTQKQRVKESSLEKMSNVIKNDKLDSLININTVKVSFDHHKDAVKQMLLKEIDYAIETEPIDRVEKKDLKLKLKHMITDNFNKPLTNLVLQEMNEKIDGLINNSKIDEEIKYNLVNKLTNTANTLLDGLTNDTMKDHIQKIFSQDLYCEIDKAPISYDIKKNLKEFLKTIISENLDQPFSKDVKDVILDNISQIIENSLIPPSVKKDLKSKLGTIAYEKFGEIPDQTPHDYAKETLMRNVKSLIDDSSLPNQQARDLKKDIVRVILESLDQPYSKSLRSDLKAAITNIINKLELSNDSKTRLTGELSTIVNKQLDTLSYHTSADHAKDRLMKNIMRIVGETSSKADIDRLRNEIKHKIDDSFQHEHLNDIKKELQEGLNDTIQQMGLSFNEKNGLTNELSNIISEILDDSFYKYYSKMHLHDMYEDMDENAVKKEDITSDTSQSQTEDRIVVDESVLNNIMKAIDDIPIANNKTSLRQKIRDVLVNNLKKPKPSKKIFQEIEKAIENVPITFNEKKSVTSEVLRILSPSLGVSQKLFTNNNDEIDIESYETRSGESAVKGLKLASGTYGSHVIPRSGPIYSQSSRQEFRDVADAYSSKTKDDVSDTTLFSTPRNAKSVIAMKKKFKMNILKDWHGIVRNLNLPENEKEDLRNDLTEVIAVQVDNLLSDPKNNVNSTKKDIEENINQILNEAAIPRKVKNDIKGLLLDAVNKNVDRIAKTFEADSDTSKRSSIDTVDSFDLETGQRVTSTPKKGRKTWRRGSDILLSKPDEYYIQSLSPEENKYWTQIIDAMERWIDNQPIHIGAETKEKIRQGLRTDIDDRLKYLQINPGAKKSVKEELDNLQYQLFRKLNKVVGDSDMNIMMEAADDLMQFMQEVETPKAMEDNQERLRIDYQQKLRDIISELLPQQGKLSAEEQASFDLMQSGLIDAFTNLHYYENNITQKTKLKKEISDKVKNFYHNYLKNHPEADINTDEITEKLYAGVNKVSLPPKDTLQSIVEQGQVKDRITDWLRELPLKEQTNMEQLKTFAKADKLAKTLRDIERNDGNLNNLDMKQKRTKAIKQFIENLPLEESHKKDTDKYIKNLVDIIGSTALAIEPNASLKYNDSFGLDDQTDMSRVVYQQQLRDLISETLPNQGDLSIDDQAAFELMKNDLADAFISLHFSGDNTEQKKKLKKKIGDEINKFCDNYTKNHPSSNINTEKLNKDLYEALQKVSLPTYNSLQPIVEQAKAKDVITDWLKELPLKEQTAVERLEMSENADTLAKALRDIERNDDKLSNQEVKQKMTKEILQFINSVPLTDDHKKDIDKYTKRLINTFEVTEEARKLDVTTGQSILVEGEALAGVTQHTFPPCSLSHEDKEHLKRIRERTCMAPDCMNSLLKKPKNNSSVDPMVTESGSQTDQDFNCFRKSSICPASQKLRRPRHVRMDCKPKRAIMPCADTGSQTNVEPQIIVKEYFWDSMNSSKQEAEICRCRKSLRRRLLIESSNLCPGAKTTPCHRFEEEEPQTCQVMPTFQPITSSSTTPYNAAVQSSFEPFTPQQHSSPRPSKEIHFKDFSNGELQKDSLPYPGSSNSWYPRNERLTDLGSLGDLRDPCPKTSNILESFDWCSRLPENGWEPPCMRSGFTTGRPCSRAERVRCSNCKERSKSPPRDPQRHYRQHSQRDHRMGSSSNHTDKDWSPSCDPCIRCPYPSYRYFRQ